MRYLKPYVEWVTGLREKYRTDLFFRTTTHVILLQAGMVLILIIAFWIVLEYNNHAIGMFVVDNIRAILTNAPLQTPDQLAHSISGIQARSIWYIFAGVIVIAIGFGVLLARFTLRPARDTLRYQKLFISNIAHELRTPLSTIKISSEVAMLDPELPSPIRKVFHSTIDELDRISSIINNLLSLDMFTRPERIQFADTDLGAIIETTVKRLNSFAEERDIKIVVKMDSYRTVWGNATALEQVVTNIIKNAISYTPRDSGGVVTVVLALHDRNRIIFSVTDTGIGIAQEDLFHIFEPFYRADTSRVRRVKQTGSGLGLAIVNEIVRIHHGRITIRSALRQGTTVSVYLPSGTPNMDAAPVHMEHTTPSESEVSVDFSSPSASATERA